MIIKVKEIHMPDKDINLEKIMIKIYTKKMRKKRKMKKKM
jgi:hypothetical protein